MLYVLHKLPLSSRVPKWAHSCPHNIIRWQFSSAQRHTSSVFYVLFPLELILFDLKAIFHSFCTGLVGFISYTKTHTHTVIECASGSLFGLMSLRKWENVSRLRKSKRQLSRSLAHGKCATIVSSTYIVCTKSYQFRDSRDPSKFMAESALSGFSISL